jgi:tetratricopeptide (TPR) repeat protein
MLEDGTPPPRPAAIERVCGTNRRIEGHTDSRGYFSIELGNPVIDSVQDASIGGIGTFGGALGNPVLSVPRGRGISEQQLMSCELHADLPGYQSQSFSLAMRRPMDDANIGTILLHRIGESGGTTVSATTLAAPKKAKKAFDKGMELARKNKLEEAQSNLQKAVELYLRYAVAWYELGRVQAAQHNPGGARQAFDESIKADAQYVPPYIQISMLVASARRWQELADVTDKALKLDSFNYPQEFLLNAVAHYNLHDVAAAEQSARRAEKLDTRHQLPQVSRLLGVILAGRREYTAAVNEFRDYLKYAPGVKDADAVRSQLADIEKLVAPSGEPQQ